MAGDGMTDRANTDESENWSGQEQSGFSIEKPYMESVPDESEKIHWAYILISSVLLVILSVLLFMVTFEAGVLLMPRFGNMVDPLHIFVFFAFVAMAFFAFGLVFILGYFSSPMDISGIFYSGWFDKSSRLFTPYYISGSRESEERFIKSQWSYLVYNNLAQDRLSRIAFCFAYLLPYMWIFGGLFITIGLLSLGIFGPFLSLYNSAIGTIILFGMTFICIVAGNMLMRAFVRAGIIKMNIPLPLPKHFWS